MYTILDVVYEFGGENIKAMDCLGKRIVWYSTVIVTVKSLTNVLTTVILHYFLCCSMQLEIVGLTSIEIISEKRI